MKKIFLSIAAIVFFPLFIAAQPLMRAQKAMDRYDYDEAIKILKKEVENEKYKSAAVPMLAECYHMQRDIFNTRAWYSRAASLADAQPKTFLYYGQALLATGEYKAALEIFRKYESFGSDGKGAFFAAHCDSVLGPWKDLKPKFEIKLVEKINTDQSEFGPVFYKGNLVFTSDYPYSLTSDKKYGWTGRGYLDMVISDPLAPEEFWGEMEKPSILDAKLNQVFHDGPCSFSTGGDTIFFTRSYDDKAKKENGFKTNLLKIFYSSRTSGGWSEPKPFFLNSPDYSIGHPALSPDGETLYFASDMPGGFGGTDLWMCRREADGWSAAINLGKVINTMEDEMFPYIKKDGSLYFASNGHPGYGALDIFCSKEIKGVWSTPLNLHPPVNSSFDDFTLSYTPNGKIGFFASNRPGGKGIDDIYEFRQKEPEFIAAKVKMSSSILQGYVKDKATQLPIESATVFILNPETGKVKITKTNAAGLYRASLESPGKLVVKAMKNGYIADCLSWPIEIVTPGAVLNAPRDLLLDKLEVNRVFRIENIYYDFDKYDIRADAEPELNKLIRIMKENPVKVELGSHTDSRGTFEYNETLAQNRAESAVGYLVDAGIDPERLIAKGYGEYQLTNECADGVPCTDQRHQANRRTEFKILGYVEETTEQGVFNPDLFKEGDVVDLFLLPSGFFYECLYNKPVATGGTNTEMNNGSGKTAKTQKTAVMLNRDLVTNTGDKYTVQIATGTIDPSILSTLDGVHSFTGPDGITRFFIGRFNKHDEAQSLLNQMVAKGFADSWIAPLDQNRQINN